jgi:hypothetical protein
MSELGGRVTDAFLTAKSLLSQNKEQKSLVKTITIIEQVLEDLRANRSPNKTLLDFLEIGPSKGFALRMKLRGLLSIKKSKLQKIVSSMKQDIDILQKISVCPYCGGSGEEQSHGYERSGRRIHTTISLDKCEQCGGSGKSELGRDVEKIVNEALKRLEESTV